MSKKKILTIFLIVIKIFFFELLVIMPLTVFDLSFLSLSSILYAPLLAIFILFLKFLFGYYIILFFMYFFNYKDIKNQPPLSKGLTHLLVATLCLVVILIIDLIFGGSMIDDFFTDSNKIPLIIFFTWVSSLLGPLIANLFNKKI